MGRHIANVQGVRRGRRSIPQWRPCPVYHRTGPAGGQRSAPGAAGRSGSQLTRRPRCAPIHAVSVQRRLGPLQTKAAVDVEPLLEELYRLYYAKLVGFVLKLTLGDVARAEDIVQETMARAWRHIDELDVTGDAARPWLFTVARRIAIDRMRARAVRPHEIRGDGLEFWPAADDGIEHAISALDVKAALAVLSEEHRAVLVHLYLLDRSISECAALMGIPVGTVRSRTHYALRALRRSLTG